jgi:hypothetical protein
MKVSIQIENPRVSAWYGYREGERFVRKNNWYVWLNNYHRDACQIQLGPYSEEGAKSIVKAMADASQKK